MHDVMHELRDPDTAYDHDHRRCERIARDIAADLARGVQREYTVSKRPMRRDAHPKHHGVVRATFVIEPNLPEELRHGVFATPGQTYAAWVRFSNAFKLKPDLHADARGIAIKLLGVNGERSPRADSKGGDRTQDFLMVTHDAFFARDAADFVDFPSAVAGDKSTLALMWPLTRYFFGVWPPRWRGAIALWRSFCRTNNPLFRHYFSQVPYRLGDTATIKLAVRANQGPTLPQRLWIVFAAAAYGVGIRSERWRDFLKRALFDYVAHRPASFDVLVRVRTATDPADQPIDDATVRWARFRFAGMVKVATLRIAQEALDPAAIEERMRFGEHLSFTPWHALADHEPAGSINCARRFVYEAISTLRHDVNRRVRREPMPGETPGEYLASIESPAAEPASDQAARVAPGQ